MMPALLKLAPALESWPIPANNGSGPMTQKINDLRDELVSGIGTYPLPDGPTATVFKTGFKLPIASVDIFPDGNITIDSTPDAKGGVFARDAIILVQGFSPYTLTKELPEYGGGATQIFLYDEYAYGERSAGNWLYEIYSDATVPSS